MYDTLKYNFYSYKINCAKINAFEKIKETCLLSSRRSILIFNSSQV